MYGLLGDHFAHQAAWRVPPSQRIAILAEDIWLCPADDALPLAAVGIAGCRDQFVNLLNRRATRMPGELPLLIDLRNACCQTFRTRFEVFGDFFATANSFLQRRC